MERKTSGATKRERLTKSKKMAVGRQKTASTKSKTLAHNVKNVWSDDNENESD